MTPSRILRFPSDRSVVWLRARGPQWPDMPHGILLGDARGDVPVPDDCAPRLLVESTAARDLSFLSRLQPGDLDALELTQTQVTDEQLRHVPHLSGLRRMSLSDTDVTDRALMHLRPLVSLQWLALWWCRGITDAAVPDLLALRGLEFLSLGRTGITDAGVLQLAALPALRTLTLEDSRVTREAVAELQRQRPGLRIEHSEDRIA
ncbi:hypothetical protein HPP05_34345 [Corallococcus exiguus]|uniref:hypothetical protein n=1 Tax=Corallococcus exiguus TaxID=83462 RepID=UPI0014944A5F|nr:hypothetical protein [Corallococcus exiguus]NPC74846.1 hypothetical protein [Corallococcus exiguus]